MKNVTKVFAVVLAFFAFVFVSCAEKTYSAEELKQFGDELKGTWTVTYSLVEDNSDEKEESVVDITLEDDDDIENFLEELSEFQSVIDSEFMNPEFEEAAKKSGGKYQITGKNAFTYNKGKISLSLKVEASVEDLKYNATVTFLAVKKAD